MANGETIQVKEERKRAEFAYNCVGEALKVLETKKQKDYRSYARKIPHMILSNGLAQTLAFVYSKKDTGNAYELIFNQITNYLKSDNTLRITMPPDENDLVLWVIRQSSHTYKHITEEILAFLSWLKRFAEGMIKTEE